MIPNAWFWTLHEFLDTHSLWNTVHGQWFMPISIYNSIWWLWFGGIFMIGYHVENPILNVLRNKGSCILKKLTRALRREEIQISNNISVENMSCKGGRRQDMINCQMAYEFKEGTDPAKTYDSVKKQDFIIEMYLGKGQLTTPGSGILHQIYRKWIAVFLLIKVWEWQMSRLGNLPLLCADKIGPFA